jgi:hypothetical protein
MQASARDDAELRFATRPQEAPREPLEDMDVGGLH